MLPKTLTFLMTALAIFSLNCPAALAEKGGHPGKGKKDKHIEHHSASDKHSALIIHNDDRVIIKKYLAEDYHTHCPPGLAKKHNGCLPPGQAKKRYVVGQVLPAAVVWTPLPEALLVRLQPAPIGYQYVMVDKDVLLISAASHKVIDAITLLSAVGN